MHALAIYTLWQSDTFFNVIGILTHPTLSKCTLRNIVIISMMDSQFKGISVLHACALYTHGERGGKGDRG